VPIVCYYPPMPVIRSAKKKLRADHRKQKINQRVEAAVKLAIKTFKKAPSPGALNKAYSALDVAAKKDVIPKGRVARKKSRLANLISKSNIKATKTKSPSKTKKVKS